MYKLKDTSVAKLIKEHCGKIEYNDYMFYKDTDELPKFKINNKIYDLIINKTINPVLIYNFFKHIEVSKILEKLKGKKIIVMFKIDINGNFDSKTVGRSSSKEIDSQIKEIFQSIAQYIPCQHDNKNVGMWDFFALPMNIIPTDKN